jgi:dienelactone hydrolase
LKSTSAVTGYSLGGHLASAFNLLYPNQAKQVVTFNGADVGSLEQGVPAQELVRFAAITGAGMFG